MKVAVVLEHRFARTPDGAVWTDGPFGYSFFGRYLRVFAQVRVVARLAEVARAEPDWARADGEGVGFRAFPYYVGPRQYLARRRAIRRAAESLLPPGEAVILRVPSQLAVSLAPTLRKQRRPYGVEVVGDPYDAFAPGAHRHPLREAFRWHGLFHQKKLCLQAAAAAYVTEHALQRRYPPAPDTYTTHYSSVELPPEAFVKEPRPARAPGYHLRLITVGSLDHFYKGPDTLLEALALLESGAWLETGAVLERGSAPAQPGARLATRPFPDEEALPTAEGSRNHQVRIELIFIGDGERRPELECMARQLGIENRVVFRGRAAAGAAVRRELDRADLFVLASRQEGLPRAMLEAMARGLPCVGSSVGGIPELLPPECVVPSGDARALAECIQRLHGNPAKAKAQSARNLAKAHEYGEEALAPRRAEFYRRLNDDTETHIVLNQSVLRSEKAHADPSRGTRRSRGCARSSYIGLPNTSGSRSR